MIISDVALEKNGARTPLKYTYKDDILKFLWQNVSKNQDYTVLYQICCKTKMKWNKRFCFD